MRFSVIVPIYNNKDWLPHCFDSILEQTFTDYEVILVDDMSYDGNIEVIEKYLPKFKKKCKGVKFIKNKSKRLNGGTRNVGIIEAEGEYVFSIDCDDYLIDNNVLSDIDKKLNGEDVMFLGYKMLLADNSTCEYIPDFKSIDEAIEGHSCSLWTRVVKTSLIKQVLYKEGTLFEDQAHHYRLMEKTKTISCLGRVTHIWNRKNQNQISKRDDYCWYRFNFCGEMYELIRTTKNDKRKEYYKGILKMFMNSCNEMVDSL